METKANSTSVPQSVNWQRLTIASKVDGSPRTFQWLRSGPNVAIVNRIARDYWLWIVGTLEGLYEPGQEWPGVRASRDGIGRTEAEAKSSATLAFDMALKVVAS